MKEQIIYIAMGLPGSGKSTWAKEEVKKSQGGIKRVNKDDLRAMLDISVWSKANEKFVLNVRDSIVNKALLDGLSVIVDDTNLHPKHRERLEELAKNYTADTGKPCRVVIKDFTDVPVQECIKRDALRTGTAHVGEAVIMKMYNEFLKKPAPKYVPPVDGLPEVLTVDLDGTLALLNGRSPYDATHCDQDEINEPVHRTVRLYINNGAVKKIIFMSGRDDKYREPTIRFLEDKCGFIPEEYELFMRKTGDQRKDSIVKKELFDSHIHGKYNPILVLDDRDSVVAMWRQELGLPTFQVAYGNF